MGLLINLHVLALYAFCVHVWWDKCLCGTNLTHKFVALRYHTFKLWPKNYLSIECHSKNDQYHNSH